MTSRSLGFARAELLLLLAALPLIVGSGRARVSRAGPRAAIVRRRSTALVSRSGARWWLKAVLAIVALDEPRHRARRSIRGPAPARCSPARRGHRPGGRRVAEHGGARRRTGSAASGAPFLGGARQADDREPGRARPLRGPGDRAVPADHRSADPRRGPRQLRTRRAAHAGIVASLGPRVLAGRLPAGPRSAAAARDRARVRRRDHEQRRAGGGRAEGREDLRGRHRHARPGVRSRSTTRTTGSSRDTCATPAVSRS